MDKEQGMADSARAASGEDGGGFFSAPPEMWIIKEGEALPEGYVLLSQGEELHADARSEDYAKWRLSKLCRACGGNAITEVKSEQFVRNSIGFSYYMSRVRGRPALIARPGRDGTLTYADIMGQFSKERSAELAHRLASQKSGTRMLVISGAVLFILCVIGFILSGGI